jgi:hypothetical protein
LEYFNTCIKSAKPGPRRTAIQANILSALLGALSGKLHHSLPIANASILCVGIAQSKGPIGKEKLIAAMKEIVMAHLNSPDSILRCAAACALGHICQVRSLPFSVNTLVLFLFCSDCWLAILAIDRWQHSANSAGNNGRMIISTHVFS